MENIKDISSFLTESYSNSEGTEGWVKCVIESDLFPLHIRFRLVRKATHLQYTIEYNYVEFGNVINFQKFKDLFFEKLDVILKQDTQQEIARAFPYAEMRNYYIIKTERIEFFKNFCKILGLSIIGDTLYKQFDTYEDISDFFGEMTEENSYGEYFDMLN